MKTNNNLIKLVTAALMAAMTCVVTMMLPIKIPYGYIHPGDGFVLLSGIVLGPIYGGLAAGVGSMMADLLGGFPQYAIATFIIKLLAAMVGAYSYRHIRKRSVVVAGLLGGIAVTAGYFIFESFLYKSIEAALVPIPFNLIQNLMGILISSILLPLLVKVPQIKAIQNLDTRKSGHTNNIAAKK